MQWNQLLEPDKLALMIPIVAIVIGGIIGIVSIIFHHRERMAMIDRGIHPDYPPEEVDPQEDSVARPGAYDRTAAYDREGVARTP